jgi:UDP-N-acetyl-D-mannosaminuronic acid dehydrogenase
MATGNIHKACFVGLGYVGLPTAVIAASEGDCEILGVDVNPSIVEMTNSGRLHFVEQGLESLLQSVIKGGKFHASITPEISDAYFIVVPTPLNSDRTPDVSYVEAATESVIPLLKPGDLFIIESTSPVGTTNRMAELIFSKRSELKDKIFIAYCPERVLPGNMIYELVHNDRVIGGINEESAVKAEQFYSQFVKGVLHRTDAKTAELCKLVENSSRDVQIAFANELSLICEREEINVWELIALANRHPRVNILKPGCGVGGHCIAVDPYFIASTYPNEARLISKAREVNKFKTMWVIERIKNAILEFEKRELRLPCVALMGLAFKPDIDDLRESPAEVVVSHLLDLCADVRFKVSEPNIKRYDKYMLSDYQEAYDNSDIVVFLTAHKEFKRLSFDNAKVILDFCGALV